MSEEWREVVGLAGRYEVSNLGNVRSLPHELVRRNGRKYPVRGQSLAVGSDRYPRVRIDGVLIYVHELVLEAFVGARPEGMFGCHNDGNPWNRGLDNLRWDTPAENNLDSVRHETNYWASRDRCINGHEFTPENTRARSDSRGRRCRTCERNRYQLKVAVA